MKNKQNKNLKNLANNYSALVDSIFRFIYFRTNSKAIAEDLTQDCFLSVVKYLKENDVDNIKAFLFKTARNKVIDYYRQKGRVIYSDDLVMANDKGSSDDFSSRYDIRIIKEKLDLLESGDKEVLAMRYIEEMEIKEIAKAIEKSETAVRVKIFRALRKLRKLID